MAATTSQGADVPATLSADTSKVDDSVEMSTLQSPIAATPSGEADGEASQPPRPIPEPDDTTAGAEQPILSPLKPIQPLVNPLHRTQTEALGPATESPIAPPTPAAAVDRGPTLSITLMLTTGARHPYKIDEKYLRNRKVELPTTAAFDPRDISGYKLKELIWTDWRSEWEPRPATPSAIRLILMGRFVEDKSALRGKICPSYTPTMAPS